MFIVLGASGHVASAVDDALLQKGLPVTAVVHDAGKRDAWIGRGARSVALDVHDSDALRRVFQKGTRAFLLNPPADVTLDTDKEERATAASIVAALVQSGLEKVVVASTFGAQAGHRIGDLSVLYEFEQGVLGAGIPVAIQRGAYYFSNWDAQMDEIRTGRLTTMFPPDLTIPMVAPADLGQAAAARLVEPFSGDTDIHLVEGPDRYSVRDIAGIFARLLDRDVAVASLPKQKWASAYEALGFSSSAATAYARMTEATVKGDFPARADTEHGSTQFEAYATDLLERHARTSLRAPDPRPKSPSEP